MRLTSLALDVIRKKQESCFLCKRIVEALKENAELGDWPKDGPTEFSAISQAQHLWLELGSYQKAIEG